MAEPQIRYCTTSDGVRIAYYVRGEGVSLVATPTSWESIQFDAEEDFGGEFYRALARHFRVIRYDRRGVGLSDRDRDDFTIEADVRDIEGVADAAAGDGFALFGLFHLGPAAIRYAALHPERLTHLILYGTYARGQDLTRDEVRRSLVTILRSHWGIASRMLVDLVAPGVSGDRLDRIALHTRSSASGDMAAGLLEMGYRTDVTDDLARIDVPTLVLHREGDRAASFNHARYLAAHIPGARLVRLDGNVLFPWFGDSDAVLTAIEQFVSGSPSAAAAPGGPAFRTVLFTDLVGHSEMMARLGDQRGRAVLREHERITREVLADHGGTEIKTGGDGFMASFYSATKGVECAVALQRAIAERNRSAAEGLKLRVGMNAGEPIEEEGDLFGSAIILASRIAAQAGEGEILVSDTVRGLLSGKGFMFADRGEVVPKGFEEPVRLYEVHWQEPQ